MPEKLTLSAYLEQRGKKAKALKKGEAEAFGIPYPLQAGWPWRYGAMEITPAMIEDAQARIRAAKLEAKSNMRRSPVGIGEAEPAITTAAPDKRVSPVPGFVLRQARRYRKSAPWA
jgi:hypothetical protein